MKKTLILNNFIVNGITCLIKVYLTVLIGIKIN